MVNYYEKLNIDKNLTTDEINKKLVELDVIWTKRSNINLEKARPMLLLISEAQSVFKTEASRREYDKSMGFYKNGPTRDIPKSEYVPPVDRGGNSGSKVGSQTSDSENTSPPIPVAGTQSSSGGLGIGIIIAIIVMIAMASYIDSHDSNNSNNTSNNQNAAVEETSDSNVFKASDVSVDEFNGRGKDAFVLKLDGNINQENQYQTFNITTGSAGLNRIELLSPNDFSVNVTLYDSNYNVINYVYADSNMGRSILANGDGFSVELKGETDYVLRVDQNHNLANYSILMKQSKVNGRVSSYNVIKDKFDFQYQRNEYTYSPLYSGEYVFYFAEKDFNDSVVASIYDENGSLIKKESCSRIGDGVTANLENRKNIYFKIWT